MGCDSWRLEKSGVLELRAKISTNHINLCAIDEPLLIRCIDMRLPFVFFCPYYFLIPNILNRLDEDGRGLLRDLGPLLYERVDLRLRTDMLSSIVRPLDRPLPEPPVRLDRRDPSSLCLF